MTSDPTESTDKESRYSLGQPVEYTWHLHRRREVDDRGRVLKRWQREGYAGQPEPEPTRGIVIGVRTLSNGENYRYGGYDEPIEYRQTETFTAYLIAFDLRRKPVLVLPEHVRAVS